MTLSSSVPSPLALGVGKAGLPCWGGEDSGQRCSGDPGCWE